MPTLDDLLDSFGLSDEGEEKVAADTTSVDVDEQAWLEQLLAEDGEEKTAGEGDMGSLADMYLQIAEHDAPGDDDVLDKLAELVIDDGQAEDYSIEKLASEYDAAGRIMARGFYDEFQKLASGELEGPSQAKTPALGDRGTEYQMETNVVPTGPIDTSGGDAQHAQILKGKAEGPAGKAEGAMGPQFATAQHLVTARASQAGAK